MRFCAMAFSSVVRTCSCPINSANDWGLYFLAMTWYMKTWLESAKGAARSVLRDSFESYARPRVIRGTRVKPLPLLPSGPGGVHSHPLHEARSLTTIHANTWRGTGDLGLGPSGWCATESDAESSGEHSRRTACTLRQMWSAFWVPRTPARTSEPLAKPRRRTRGHERYQRAVLGQR